MLKGRIKFLIPLALVALLFFIPQFVKSPYYLRVLINMFYLTILAVSLRLVFSTGQISAAHYAFLGIGAYTSALMTTRLDWNFWATLPLAGLAGAAVAVVLGYITLRIKGAYFAIATFAVAEVLRMVWVQWQSLFGGASGIIRIPSPDPIGGWKFGSTPSFYYLGLVLMLFTVLVLYRLDRSRFGTTFRGIAAADNLAEAVGINIMNYKVFAFAVACFFAGLAGAYYASLLHYISPVDFTSMQSLLLIVFLVVGGRGSIWGPIVGVFVLEGLPVLLKHIPDYDPKAEPIIYGGFLLLVMLFLPAGIIDIPPRLWARIKGVRRAT